MVAAAMVTRAPRIRAADSPGCSTFRLVPRVAAATGTPSCAAASELRFKGCPASLVREWLSSAPAPSSSPRTVSYTHLRAHETRHDLVCRLLLEKKKKK